MANTVFSGNLPLKGVHDSTTITSQTAVTADSTGTTAVRVARPSNALLAILDVTAPAADGGDSITVWLQTSVEIGGSNVWLDVVAFTAVTGSGGGKRHVAKIEANGSQSMYETGTSLSAGNLRHLMGDEWRCRWSVTDS